MGELEIIEVYSSRVEAEVAKGYLESAGIKTRIIADDADQLYPSLGAVKGIKLIAHTSDVKKAKIMLKEKQ